MFGTPEYWRERAREVRSVAHDMNDSECRRVMLDIAESYERVAERIEVITARPRPSLTNVN
jgi:hypothetical protein